VTGPAEHRYTFCEQQSNYLDCWSITRRLEDQLHLFLLDSAGKPGRLGRYSILAWCPHWEFVAKEGVARGGPPGETQVLKDGVLTELERTLDACSVPTTSQATGAAAPEVCAGGAIGYLAYEFLHDIEKVSPNPAPDLGVPDCHLLFCDVVLITDELERRSWLVANGWGSGEADSRTSCMAKLATARAACSAVTPADPVAELATLEFGRRLQASDLERYGIKSITDRERYLTLVQAAREHIAAGDVFELCLTQRFDTEFAGEGVDLYAAMRAINPAPMAAYLRFPGLEVLSCSPERFLRVNAQRWVETRPIKGTRPRGRTPLEDNALAIDLATADKDAAENIMIVDLARNDLGRVCEFGTVTVPELRVVERYPSVYQLVSTVRGHLRQEATAAQLLRATFPGGSMTGAPKVEAMRLINLLEDSRRGVFSGAIGYMSYSGLVDLNIVIRTIVKRGSILSFHAGGAVTYDSIPEAEYQETLDKANALVRAIESARVAASEPVLVR
jgi:para-aminobenzoate synthetase component 1